MGNGIKNIKRSMISNGHDHQNYYQNEISRSQTDNISAINELNHLLQKNICNLLVKLEL
jgi:hypothetical protein